MEELRNDVEFLEASRRPDCLIELRLDQYSDLSAANLGATLRAFDAGNVLVTHRSPDEGGRRADATDAQRFYYLSQATTLGAAFVDGPVTTHLTAAAGGASEVLAADGPGASVLERVPMVMIARRGRGAQFACLLELVAKGRKPAVTAVEAQRTAAGVRVTIRNGDATDTVAVTPAGALSVTAGGKVVLEARED